MAVISPVKVKAPQATRDLGMAGVARRAAWLHGENAKSRVEKRDGAVRFYVRPFLPELEVTLPSFIPRPPSVPVEYRGPTARHVECRCSIITSTHYSLTLPPGTSLSLCPSSLELTEEEDRAS